jgi:hypothetical protein
VADVGPIVDVVDGGGGVELGHGGRIVFALGGLRRGVGRV